MRRLRIVVVGGFSPQCTEEEVRCAEELGRSITHRGHTVFNGCFNEFDRVVASAAIKAAEEGHEWEDPKMAVQSFISDDKPSHRIGLLRNLRVKSWDPGQEGWSPPELLAECDALIGMGGGPGTHRAFHLTRLINKPILPITAFGGAAVEAFATESNRFEKVYGGRISKEEYSVLDTQFPDDIVELANRSVDLAETIVEGNSVFVVMAFRQDLDETFDTISRVAGHYNYNFTRTDREHTTGRIYPRIVKGIRTASLVVADVTYGTANVYYELGFSEALDKDTIVIARVGSSLEFDLQDKPTIFYTDQQDLERRLCERIEGITGRKKQPSDSDMHP